METKEQLGGFVAARGARPRRGAGVGRADAVERRRPRHRDPAGHGLRRIRRAASRAAPGSAPRPERARRSARRRAPVPRALRARGRGADPLHRRLGPRRGGGPGRVRDGARALAARRRAARPARRGSSRSRATARSTASGASARCAPASPRARGARRPTEPTEEPVATSVPDERLRLIFTCCHPALAPRGAGRADAAAARRALDRRGRARVPGARADDGAAAGARQGEDPRRADPVPRPARRRAARAARRGARRRLPRSSTRATRPAPATRTSATSLCAEALAARRDASPS